MSSSVTTRVLINSLDTALSLGLDFSLHYLGTIGLT